MTPDHLLEQAMWDTFWVPPQTSVVDRPPLRYTTHPHDIPILNVLLRIRAQPSDLPALVHEVRHAHRGRRSRVMVNPQNRHPALHDALHHGQYAPIGEYDAHVLSTDHPRAPIRDGLQICRVETREHLRTAHHVSNLAFDRSETLSEAEEQSYLAGCQDPAGRVHRFVIHTADGTPLTAGGLTLFPHLRFGFLWGGGTIPSGRGQGAYSALVTCRLRCARQHNIDIVGLYADVNTSAPIVSAQGFSRHGRMTYWQAPAAST